MVRAGQQFARFQEPVKVGESDDAIGRGSAHEVLGQQLGGMIKTRRGNELRQRLDALTMEVCNTHRLVGHHDGALPPPVLAGHSGWTMARMTLLRLNTTDSKHESARGIAPVCPQRHHPRHVEPRGDLAGCADPDRSRKLVPTRAECTKVNPSRSGMPR